MIVFDLDCMRGHRFEGWFRSSDDFAEQQEAGIIACPECGSTEVCKAVSAPHLRSSSSSSELGTSMTVGEDEAVPQAVGAPSLPPRLRAELDRVFSEIREHVENSCDYVGENFAEEARRIYYGETEERGIYGEATAEETAELVEEGIEPMPLPPKRGKGPATSDA